MPYEEVKTRVGTQTSAFPVLALSKLYNFPFNEKLDDRVRLIEFQYEEDVPLNENTLKAVIVCKEWTRDPDTQRILEGLGCAVETYPLYPLASHCYYSTIYEISQKICGA